MKSNLLCLLSFVALTFSLRAADDAQTTALRTADDARVAAMKAADPKQLAAIFSDDLRYAHSTGAVDGKASMIETLSTGRTKYVTYDYAERNFTFPAPGIALMTGRTTSRRIPPPGPPMVCWASSLCGGRRRANGASSPGSPASCRRLCLQPSNRAQPPHPFDDESTFLPHPRDAWHGLMAQRR